MYMHTGTYCTYMCTHARMHILYIQTEITAGGASDRLENGAYAEPAVLKGLKHVPAHRGSKGSVCRTSMLVEAREARQCSERPR